jgi:hypothetical protein
MKHSGEAKASPYFIFVTLSVFEANHVMPNRYRTVQKNLEIRVAFTLLQNSALLNH